ncbi:hypothetical protein J5N97_022696 [Dioscorea zingiberensis]|uniref:KIB1-4 beta-propeller domain-containing protein n=1 Tax=Dioscorea zingiberensis TaxID=325984 RepID=A0A9D5CBE7_9LILI|nr:hypothetical protein J5N97_022696 [Dioscorea zingiberensis]
MPNSPSRSKGSYWSQLLPELLNLISTRLTDIADVARFRAICSQWRLAAPHLLAQPLPWLIPPFLSLSLPDRFFSLSSNSILNLTLLPDSPGAQCVGSSRGWLFILGLTPSFSLLNPFLPAQIRLPSLTTLPFILKFCDSDEVEEEYVLMAEDGNIYTETASEVRDSTIQKAFLSSDLSDAACLAFILLSGPHTLAFSLLVSDSWTMVKDFGYPPSRISDITFHDGRCFILDSIGRLRVSDIGHSDPPKFSLISTIKIPWGFTTHLVESSHNLLLVLQRLIRRSESYSDGLAPPFHVHSIDLSGNPRLLDVEEFSGEVLFLGHNHSFSLSVKDAVHGRFQGNQVFFTAACCVNGSRGDLILRYDHKDHSVHCVLFNDFDGEERSVMTSMLEFYEFKWATPKWVFPSLCSR